MNILITEPDDYNVKALEIYSRLGNVRTLNSSNVLSEADTSDIDVLVVRLNYFISNKIIGQSPRLKYIISTTTGTDHIDEAAVSEKGIRIISLRGETRFLQTLPSSAEFTWSLLLAISKNIVPAVWDVREGNWERLKFRSINLRDKTLGILGLGRIGKQVASFGLAFNMKVMAFDPYQQYWLDGVQRTDSCEALFSHSDFLVILINAFGNHKFVSSDLLKKTKKGAFIVNTSRGSVWDEQAVIDLLLSSHLAGAATDVITNETDPAKRLKSPLMAYNGKLSNLIITPHLAGATRESMEASEEYLAEKFMHLFQSV